METDMKSNHTQVNFGNNMYHEATYYNHDPIAYHNVDGHQTQKTDSYQHHYEPSQYDQHSQSEYDKHKKYKEINVIHQGCACCPDCIQYVSPPPTTTKRNQYNYYYMDMDNYNQSICDEDGFCDYDYNYNYRPNGVLAHNPFRHNVNSINSTINGLTVIQE